MKKSATIHAVDKKIGMTVPEILSALKATKSVIPCGNVTVSIGFNGRIKSITLTEKQENNKEVCMDWIGLVIALGIAFLITVGTLGLFLLVALAIAAVRMVK